MKLRDGVICCVALLALLAAGCGRAPMPRPPVGDLSKEEVLAALRHNAEVIATIRTVDVVTTVYVPQAMPWRENLEGRLGFRQPASLRLRFRHPLGVVSCDLGRNDAQWWVYLELPDDAQFYSGHVDEPPPGEAALPLHPDDIAYALGVSAFDTRRVAMEKVPGHYVLTEIGFDGEGEGLAIKRRSWIDADTLRVTRFEAFDSAGAPRLVARQSEFADLGGMDRPVYLPTRIDFDWLGQGTLSLKLRHIQVGFPLPVRMFEAPEID